MHHIKDNSAAQACTKNLIVCQSQYHIHRSIKDHAKNLPDLEYVEPLLFKLEPPGHRRQRVIHLCRREVDAAALAGALGEGGLRLVESLQLGRIFIQPALRLELERIRKDLVVVVLQVGTGGNDGAGRDKVLLECPAPGWNNTWKPRAHGATISEPFLRGVNLGASSTRSADDSTAKPGRTRTLTQALR